MNSDFLDMLSALSGEGSEYLVVGAYAMAANGYVRATGDLDLWVRPTEENAAKVWRALVRFGAPLQGLSQHDLTGEDVGIQFGLPPRRIDVLTSIAGIKFDEAWKGRLVLNISQLAIPCLSREELIRNKRATGRPRDLSDALWMENSPPSPERN